MPTHLTLFALALCLLVSVAGAVLFLAAPTGRLRILGVALALGALALIAALVLGTAPTTAAPTGDLP